MSRYPLLRGALAAALLCSAGGCLAGFPSRPEVMPQPAFDPIAFFTGRTHGEGTLDVRVGSDRTLTVEGTGRQQTDGSFRLDQTVTYADGAVETRTWQLRRTDATHFTATLSDASGPVEAEVEGNRFHLRYKIRNPAVYMEQWLYARPDGRTVDNLAQVTVLGVPWARLAETITRRD
jgi:hypothetical protein